MSCWFCETMPGMLYCGFEISLTISPITVLGLMSGAPFGILPPTRPSPKSLAIAWRCSVNSPPCGPRLVGSASARVGSGSADGPEPFFPFFSLPSPPAAFTRSAPSTREYCCMANCLAWSVMSVRATVCWTKFFRTSWFFSFSFSLCSNALMRPCAAPAMNLDAKYPRLVPLPASTGGPASAACCCCCVGFK